MMKQMNVIHFLIKDILRKKIRTLLTILGVSIGICVCIIMLGIGQSIRNSFKDIYGRHKIDIIAQERNQLTIMLSKLDMGLENEIRKIPEVSDAAGVYLYIYQFKRNPVPVYGCEQDEFIFEGIDLIKGRKPISGNNEVIAGDALMASLPGENRGQVTLKGENFKIVGVYKSRSPFERFALVAQLKDLQGLTGEKDKVNFINVRLKPEFHTAEHIEKVIRQIETACPQLTAMKADVYAAEKAKFIVMGDKFSLLVSVITVIAVILGLANTMATSSFEKRKFLSILLALGWQKAEIAMLFLCESLIIGIVGGAIGMWMGFKGTEYVFWLTDIRAFIPTWDPAFILKIVVLIIGSSIVAAIVPTWLTLNSNLLETIRGE